MGWVRVDDAFYDHQKFLVAGPLAGWLWLTSLAWSNRNLTDGFIPHQQVLRLVNFDGVTHRLDADGRADTGQAVDPYDLASDLVRLRLWEDVEGGYAIHDYDDYQPSAASIRAEREKARQRMQKRATDRTEPPPPDPDSEPDSRFAGSSGEVRANNGRSSPSPNPNPNPNPNPVNPIPEEDLRAAQGGALPCALADALPVSQTTESFELEVVELFSADEFERWYAAFPRHRSKAAARKAWAKARQKASFETLMEGARVLRESGRDPQYIPYPATWLNSEGWLDEPEAPHRAKGRALASLEEHLANHGLTLADLADDAPIDTTSRPTQRGVLP